MRPAGKRALFFWWVVRVFGIFVLEDTSAPTAVHPFSISLAGFRCVNDFTSLGIDGLLLTIY